MSVLVWLNHLLSWLMQFCFGVVNREKIKQNLGHLFSVTVAFIFDNCLLSAQLSIHATFAYDSDSFSRFVQNFRHNSRTKRIWFSTFRSLFWRNVFVPTWKWCFCCDETMVLLLRPKMVFHVRHYVFGVSIPTLIFSILLFPYICYF